MRMDRTILHCDCNSFYASVECALDPKLKNVPMAVGGDLESRHGIILAKNELAKKRNVRTAETIWQAKIKCPGLVIVPPHHDIYETYSQIINEIYQQYTDLVEPFGIDESYLDVTGSRYLFGDGKTIADTLRARIKKEVGVTISVGVSFNKAFAKLGSDYKKPDATTIISRENFREIVFPLPVNALLFVGGKANEVLGKMQIQTIGDLAGADDREVIQKLGKLGSLILRYARGEDEDPVKSAFAEEAVKSVGNGMTFAKDLVGLEEIQTGIYLLSDRIATRMRHKGMKCMTVQVQIKDPNFKTISRQITGNRPTYLAKEIREIALELVKKFWNLKKPIRALTITCTNLVQGDYGQQLTLFDDNSSSDRQEKIESTVDSLRQKYGQEIVTAARIIRKSEETV